MSRIRITDLTIRDAHQSLFATRMLTEDMLPVAKQLTTLVSGRWKPGAAQPLTPASAS